MSQNYFLARRQRALAQLQPNSAMLLFGNNWDMGAAGPKLLDDGAPPASDFYYLSGCEDKETCMLLLRRDGAGAAASENGGTEYEQIIFCPQPSEFIALWTGGIQPPEQVARGLGFDKGLSLEEFADFLRQALRGIANLYYPLGKNSVVDEKVSALLRELNDAGRRRGWLTPTQLINSDEILAELRIIKDAQELALISKAAEISVGGHQRLRDGLYNYNYEYEAEAELGYYYRQQGARHAFPPIVAGGGNACVLHYTQNDAPLSADAGLLVDSGASFNNYAADMTRCYPPQQDIEKRRDYLRVYEAVLSVHKKLCALAAPGVTLEEIHKYAVRHLTEELIKLKILTGDLETAIRDNSYKKYFPHKTSHWIGLEVHDLGSYRSRPLEAGMVFSIEPGLYFPPDDKGTDARWHNIGVRIEDTIAITEAGAINLTAAMPYCSKDE